MKKLLFVKPTELNETIETIIKTERNDNTIRCEIGYSEIKSTDVALITYTNGEATLETEEMPIKDLFHQLNDFYKVEIISFDVYEVGDFGEGFSFSIK